MSTFQLPVHLLWPAGGPVFRVPAARFQASGYGTTVYREVLEAEELATGFNDPPTRMPLTYLPRQKATMVAVCLTFSGDADPATGYQIFLAGKPGVVGGTSAVAPLWAGLVARVNQRLAAIGSKPAGFFNPLIYNSSVISEGAFHDIVVGNNDITGTLNGLYPAGQGWDAATGLGSPDGTKLLQVLGG